MLNHIRYVNVNYLLIYLSLIFLCTIYVGVEDTKKWPSIHCHYMTNLNNLYSKSTSVSALTKCNIIRVDQFVYIWD
jgi:hypothetical protein